MKASTTTNGYSQFESKTVTPLMYDFSDRLILLLSKFVQIECLLVDGRTLRHGGDTEGTVLDFESHRKASALSDGRQQFLVPYVAEWAHLGR
jgi:hypothetical protein